jgi:hypothetical protein
MKSEEHPSHTEAKALALETGVSGDARRSKMIYFLRKKGTTDQFYQRRGGRKCHYGCKRGTRTTVWGPRHTAACWTSPRGPRAVKGQDGEVVAFSLSSEEGRVVV